MFQKYEVDFSMVRWQNGFLRTFFPKRENKKGKRGAVLIIVREMEETL